MGGGYGYWDVGKEGQKIVGCGKEGKNSGMLEIKKVVGFSFVFVYIVLMNNN